MRKILLFLVLWISCYAKVELGVDCFFSDVRHIDQLRGKRVGLITNHTGVDSALCPTSKRLELAAQEFKLIALFSPEHGIGGQAYAGEKIEHIAAKIPIYSLHGETRRPTAAMLKGIDILIYDIQEIGSRSYTYATTLFYAMEEAAKRGIKVIVLDRPNPMGGLLVDGPMLDPEQRSFLGYINVPYCHGMTIGELARFFNAEYKIGCTLSVIPMRGWVRAMSFKESGLEWIPTSPNIPEPDTPFFYATTGILGELELVNIGIGYTLPFKLVGAPWINAEDFAQKLNAQKLPGVHFLPFHFHPFYGSYKAKDCHGVKIAITDRSTYRPLAVQFLLLGMLKTLYPEEIEPKLRALSDAKKHRFCQLTGSKDALHILLNEKFAARKLIHFQQAERQNFLEQRRKYLLY